MNSKITKRPPRNLVAFVAATLLLPSFFCQTLLTSSIIHVGIYLMSLIITFFLAIKCGWRIDISKPTIILMLFYSFCFFGIINTNDIVQKWFMVFGLTGLTYLILENSNIAYWGLVFIKSLSFLGLIYSIITLLCFIVPSLYTGYIQPNFFPTAYRYLNGGGYKAGFTSHYSTNGIYISLGLMGTFAYLLHGKNTRIYRVVFAIELLALVLTTKRAHLAFSVMSCITAYLIYSSGKRLTSFAKLLIVLAVLLGFFYILQEVNDGFRQVVDRFSALSEDDTLNGRVGFYDLCIEMWKKSPLIGNGWDSFTEHVNQTARGMRSIRLGNSALNAHNVYLQILAEQGIIGIVLFISSVVGFLRKSVHSLIAVSKSDFADAYAIKALRGLLAGSICIQVFFIMYCMTGNPLYDIQMYVPWLGSLALGVMSAKIADSLVKEKKSLNGNR